MTTIVKESVAQSQVVFTPELLDPSNWGILQKYLVENGYRPGTTSSTSVAELRKSHQKLARDAANIGSKDYARLLHCHAMSMGNNTLALARRYAAITFMPADLHSYGFHPHPLVAERAKADGVKPNRFVETCCDEAFRLRMQLCGTAYVNLHEDRFPFIALTLTRQPWHMDKVETWRVDGYTPWVDYNGRLRIGGVECRGEAEASHHRFWFDLCTNIVQKPTNLDKYSPRTTVLSIDMVTAIERAVIAGDSVRNSLSLPRLWYGVMDEELFGLATTDVIETPELIRDFMMVMDVWLQAGHREGIHPTMDALAKIPESEYLTPGTGFATAKKILGEMSMNNLLLEFRSDSVLQFEDRFWLPADYLPPTNSHKPWLPGMKPRKIVTFGSDCLGKQIVRQGTGEVFYDYFQAAPQVISLSKNGTPIRFNEAFQGQDGATSYNLVHVPYAKEPNKLPFSR